MSRTDSRNGDGNGRISRTDLLENKEYRTGSSLDHQARSCLASVLLSDGHTSTGCRKGYPLHHRVRVLHHDRPIIG